MASDSEPRNFLEAPLRLPQTPGSKKPVRILMSNDSARVELEVGQ